MSLTFKLRVSDVDYGSAEIAISGTLVEGAYSGPEAVELFSRDGSTITATVTHHRILFPVDWPIVPEHTETILTISIPPPSKKFRLDPKQPVVGLGVLFKNSNREDVSDALSDPRFWAWQLSAHLSSDEVEEEAGECLGFSADELEAFHEEFLEARFSAGVWPFIRFPIQKNRFVEIEFAASIELQERFWIGDSGTQQRVLLGYHSPHFSLPAFRFEELLKLDARFGRAGVPRAALLLLLSACYVPKFSGPPHDLAVELFATLPGVKKRTARSMAKGLGQNLTVPDLAWKRDRKLGWVNNWKYSQRSPAGLMSVLGTDEFAFIANFF